MADVTKNVADYLKHKGIKIAQLSRETNIPYGVLMASLGKSQRGRKLRVEEFLLICEFLEIDPYIFSDSK